MSLIPVPVSDEQAKAIQETAKLGSQSLETARSVGGYLARIFGTVPENLVGLLGADWIEYKRFENLAKLTKRARDFLRELEVEEIEEVSLSIGLPLMHAAADESREELLSLWARLLASAMDPARSRFVRRSFIQIVQRMDPVDARVFAMLDGATSYGPNARDFLTSRIDAGKDAIEVSLNHLGELKLTGPYDPTNWGLVQRVDLTALGRELKRVL